MSSQKLSAWFLWIYVLLFVFVMLSPLIVMGGAALNDSRFPSVYPWKGFTSEWFVDLWNDERMWISSRNTVLVALGVIALSLPIGTAGAILINSLSGLKRGVIYGLMVAPILTPGAVIGISTLVFWREFGVPTGLHLSTLGQTSFIAAYVMLLVLARLQSFDTGLEEAALDLGASYWQVLRRILLPHLYPALIAGAVIGFFQSVENFNVTLFTRGSLGHADGLCRLESPDRRAADGERAGVDPHLADHRRDDRLRNPAPPGTGPRGGRGRALEAAGAGGGCSGGVIGLRAWAI